MEELAEVLDMRKSDDFKLLVKTIAQMEREKTVEFNKRVGSSYLFNQLR